MSATTCPNCGHDQFDHDGDCLSCREPHVVAPGADIITIDVPPQVPADDRIAELAKLANDEHKLCEASARDAVDHAVAAGKHLTEIKDSLQHGDWGDWLEKHFQGSPRTARGYMLLAREWPKLSAQIGSGVANLSLRKALAKVADASRLIAKHDKREQRQLLKAWEKFPTKDFHQAIRRAEVAGEIPPKPSPCRWTTCSSAAALLRDAAHEARSRVHPEDAPLVPGVLRDIADELEDAAAKMTPTLEQTAEMFGVSPEMVLQAKRIIDESPDLAERVERGEITLDEAESQLPQTAAQPFAQLLRDAIQQLWSDHPEVPAIALHDLLEDIAREAMEGGPK